jgi:hypothetical protein
MVPLGGSHPAKRSPADALAEVELLAAELESVLRRLRREANSPRTAERARELRKDRQVGMEPDPLDATNP